MYLVRHYGLECLRTAKFILLSTALKDDSLMTSITVTNDIKKSYAGAEYVTVPKDLKLMLLN